MAIIAVDFDGTLALGDSFPDVNNATPNTVLIRALNHLQSMGHQIVLWTCRENYGGKHYEDGPYLIDAVKFCEKYGLNFDAVNKNIGSRMARKEPFMAGKSVPTTTSTIKASSLNR